MTGPLARVRILEAKGSTPRDAGAEMLVSPSGLEAGTIGGGQFEFRAIAAARALLEAGGGTVRLEIPLGPEIGQCCGGFVTVEVTALDGRADEVTKTHCANANASRPEALILGAGHVGRALARALALLPCHVRLIDGREEELQRLEGVPTVKRCLTALPEAAIRAAGPGAAFIILTHDHGLDFMLTAEALRRGDAAYIGLIGSHTKRAGFERWARRDAPGLDITSLHCPLAATAPRDKRPEVIAAFTAAEVMAAFAKQASAARHQPGEIKD